LTQQTTLALTAIALCLCGTGGMLIARCSKEVRRIARGRRLFLAALIGLGVLALYASGQPHHGVVYAGLSLGGLVIGMLWEGPQAGCERMWAADRL